MSLGPDFSIAYFVPGETRLRLVSVTGDGGIVGSNDARELGVTVSGNGNVRRVFVNPEVPVHISSVEATMHVALDDADAIFLNGYNSWTDSVERGIYDRMWGLTRAPRRLIDKYVLDASGDYRFVEENNRRGHQHGFGYGYLRQGDEVLLFGSLDEDSGYTVIWEDAGAQTLTFCKEPPNRTLEVGEKRCIIALAVVGGPLEKAVDLWLGLSGIKPLAAPPIVGYTSWYRHYGDIDAWKLSEDLAGTAQVLLGMDLGGAEPVFQIDDGYAKVGDWLEYDRSRFPEGLRGIAREAAAQGFRPGLWLAPFLCERTSRIFAEHQDWLLRDAAGELVTTGSQWSGGYALDVRNFEVRTYIGKVLRTVTSDWGFKLLKLDFLYAACLETHDGLNRGELMADALELLRSSVNDDVRLLFCGVPLVSAFGRCAYCRVGQDVGLDWDDKPRMRLLHRERISTKLSLANARGRAHLDGRAFRCDPDVLFLREDGVSFTKDQREEMLFTDATCGGVLFTSDNMAEWNAGQLDRYHEVLANFRASNGV